MKNDRLLRALLWIITVLLFLNLAHNFLSSRSAGATPGNEAVGRYQISAWGAQAGAYTHHSGYYVLDTATGKVVDSKMEVHAVGE
jgi:hypothetical protein